MRNSIAMQGTWVEYTKDGVAGDSRFKAGKEGRREGMSGQLAE